mgnify:CR=1 FL=1
MYQPTRKFAPWPTRWSASQRTEAPLKEWAKRLALRERSFARLMQRETGLSFGHWHQQLHLIIALRGLASCVSVQNVAATFRYESVNALITMLRKAMGSTAAHYFAERKNSGR